MKGREGCVNGRNVKMQTGERGGAKVEQKREREGDRVFLLSVLRIAQWLLKTEGEN